MLQIQIDSPFTRNTLHSKNSTYRAFVESKYSPLARRSVGVYSFCAGPLVVWIGELQGGQISGVVTSPSLSETQIYHNQYQSLMKEGRGGGVHRKVVELRIFLLKNCSNKYLCERADGLLRSPEAGLDLTLMVQIIQSCRDLS